MDPTEPVQDEVDFVRQYSRPLTPEPGKHARHTKSIRNTISILITDVVIGIAVTWIVAANVFHVQYSRFTFTSALVGLIIYAGNFINWERPRLPERKPRQAQWRNRD